MIPKILHQSSKSFTWEERRLAKRARTLMPEWDYHLWRDEDNLALVRQMCPGDLDRYVSFRNGGIRSDIARYLYMYKYGGIYFDTDFKFYQPVSDVLLCNKCIIGIEEEDMPELGGGPKLGNAFIGSEPGLTLWTELVASIFARSLKGEIPYAWQLSGPYALTAFLKNHDQHREKVTILPRNVVYPQRKNFYLTSARDRETIGVHLMWGSWRDTSLREKAKYRIRKILSATLS